MKVVTALTTKGWHKKLRTDLINVLSLVKCARQKDTCHRWTFLCEDYQIFANTHRSPASHHMHMSTVIFQLNKLSLCLHTHTHNRLTALFPGLPGWAGTRKVKPIWLSLKQETVSGSGISWAICKSAPRSRQITMPAPHHSVFYRLDALPAAQPTVSKHWRQFSLCLIGFFLIQSLHKSSAQRTYTPHELTGHWGMVFTEIQLSTNRTQKLWKYSSHKVNQIMLHDSPQKTWQCIVKNSTQSRWISVTFA